MAASQGLRMFATPPDILLFKYENRNEQSVVGRPVPLFLIRKIEANQFNVHELMRTPCYYNTALTSRLK